MQLPNFDFIGDVYKKFIKRLTEKYRQHLAILGYIPGTFDAEEARAMLGKLQSCLIELFSQRYRIVRLTFSITPIYPVALPNSDTEIIICQFPYHEGPRADTGVEG